MTAEIAVDEIGPGGVPALLRLLEDATFPRRDNVVAFLAYLGGRETTAPLEQLLARGVPRGVPEEERARLLVPHALGRIAGRGDTAALDALLAMTAHHAGGGPVASSPLKDDLLDAAISSLALAGGGRARERLEAIAAGRVVPDAGHPEAADRARTAMEVVSPPGGGSTSVAPASGPVAAAGAYVVDHAGRSVAHGISFANHVNVANPMTASRLDAVLKESTRRAARGDFATDVACCTVVSRIGAGPTWGSLSDGLATIDSAVELSNVLGQSAGRVKIVTLINYCGGPGTNIIGCGYQPGQGAALVRMSDLGYEAVLWIHEYGHNIGLAHAPGDRALMSASDNGRNDGLTQGECATFHNPSGEAQALLGDAGTCTDDGDSLADPIDNCPGVANDGQADTNRNGIGDACEGAPIIADVDLSGRVDGLDLARLGRAFGSRSGEPRYDGAADLDHDGIIDGADLALLVSQFGEVD